MDRKKLRGRLLMVASGIFGIIIFIGAFIFLGKWELSDHLDVTDRYFTSFCITVIVMAVVCTLGTIISALITDKKEKE